MIRVKWYNQWKFCREEEEEEEEKWTRNDVDGDDDDNGDNVEEEEEEEKEKEGEEKGGREGEQLTRKNLRLLHDRGNHFHLWIRYYAIDE